MPMPTDIGVIDLMIGFPEADRRHYYDFLRANLRDHESLDEFEFPAQYMFKNVPKVEASSDPVKALLELMDKYGIERAMIGVATSEESPRVEDSQRALREHPDRFFGCVQVDPNRGMDAVRDLTRAVEELGVKGASAFPCRLTAHASKLLVLTSANTFAAWSLSTLPKVSARLEVLPTARSADWLWSVRPEESSTKT